MPEYPLVSVVMAAYNEEAHVGEALESVLNQTWPNVEVIVVDDGSTDGTRAILRDYQRREQICLIENAENMGLPRSLNRGIKQANGRYIARMDADEESAEDRLQKQVAVLEHDKALVGAACGYSVMDESGYFICSIMPEKQSGFTVDYFVENGPPFCHGSVMMRKSALARVGLYRPQFTLAQDLDLWLRLCEEGNFFVIPELLYTRRLDPGVMGKREQQRYYAAYARKSALSRREGRADPALELDQARAANLRTTLTRRDRQAYKHYLISIKQRQAGNVLAAQASILRALLTNPLHLRFWYRLLVNLLPHGLRNQVVNRVQERLARGARNS